MANLQSHQFIKLSELTLASVEPDDTKVPLDIDTNMSDEMSDAMTVYHYTDKVFDKLDPDFGSVGIHAGSISQAENIAKYYKDKDKNNKPFSLTTGIKDKLRFPDLGSNWRPSWIWLILKNTYSIITPATEQSLLTGFKDYGRTIEDIFDHLDQDESTEERKRVNRFFRAKLLELGYNGLCYINRQEGLSERDEKLLKTGKNSFDVQPNYMTDKEFIAKYPSAKNNYSYVLFDPYNEYKPTEVS